MTTLAAEVVSVKIDGEELADLYQGMTLEVELDDELASTLQLQLPLQQATDGSWSLLDDARLRVWRAIRVEVGFGGEREELFSGYVTQLRPQFGADASQCRLELWAIDESVLLDREDKLKDWPDKTDSDIATEIFGSYGLTPEVEATDVTHDSATSTVLQRETDMQFLRRLAQRNGFECFVEGRTGYFRAPSLASPPQPVLAAHFGDETTLTDVSFEVNALVPASVAMTQLDRRTKDILQAVVTTSQRPALGRTGSAQLLSGAASAARVQVAGAVTTGAPEMTALCQGLFDRSQWFVTGTGEIAANAYGHVLRPRATVTIKGVGEAYSGVYYVTHVSHRLSTAGYTQRFSVVRDGLGLTGSEDFAGSSGGLL